MTPTTLHEQAAREWVDLHYAPGELWPTFRRLSPLVAELDERYGPGWEYGDTFLVALDAAEREIGLDGFLERDTEGVA